MGKSTEELKLEIQETSTDLKLAGWPEREIDSAKMGLKDQNIYTEIIKFENQIKKMSQP